MHIVFLVHCGAVVSLRTIVSPCISYVVYWHAINYEGRHVTNTSSVRYLPTKTHVTSGAQRAKDTSIMDAPLCYCCIVQRRELAVFGQQQASPRNHSTIVHAISDREQGSAQIEPPNPLQLATPVPVIHRTNGATTFLHHQIHHLLKPHIACNRQDTNDERSLRTVEQQLQHVQPTPPTIRTSFLLQ